MWIIATPWPRARVWRVLRIVGSDVVGEVEAIDAYYIHYRVPILGGRVSSPLWRRFVQIYVNSPYYDKIASLCRLRHGPSLRAAVSLLRTFVDYLRSLEWFGRAWFGMGRQDAWVEALRHLRRHFGDPSNIEMLYDISKTWRDLG